jgi:hypothetical protein
LPRAQSRPNANIGQVEKSDWIHFVTPRHRRDTTFWLDLERDVGRPEEVNWTLYFDIIPGAWSPRRISTIAEVIDVPEQAEWRVALKGAAMVQAATLVVESVYAIPVERGEDAL